MCGGSAKDTGGIEDKRKICFFSYFMVSFYLGKGRKDKGKRKKSDQREKKIIFDIAFLDSNFL